MANHICKYCGIGTDYRERVCRSCGEKLELIRKIKAMLMPSYKLKKDLENKQLWEEKKAEREKQ